MAHPHREVVVMVGDGSYLMLNSEIATSVMLGTKLVIVVLDNRGYGCIHRLQRAVGGEGFNNLFDDCVQDRRNAGHRLRAHRPLAGPRRPSMCARSPNSKRRSPGRARPIDLGRRHRHDPFAHDRGGRMVVGSGRAGSLWRRTASALRRVEY
jgi:hypothetical protein